MNDMYCVFQYLTTVIPYHLNQGPPTIEQLQIYIKSKLQNYGDQLLQNVLSSFYSSPRKIFNIVSTKLFLL